ncbi:MAG: hypothetical protein KJ058_07190, partial [Thermoanaerobaculia bacterium]|nr:hypothetical protein [Thermoanaerobaculia bacterium]
MSFVGLAAAARGGAQVGESYYIPLPAPHVRDWAQAQEVSTQNDNLRTRIGIVVTAADAVLYWDHWEDGFEFEIEDPASPAPNAGVEIWGDQDCANGFRPDLGTCSDDALDRFAAGDVLTLEDDVAVPGGVRNASQVYFDGGDKVFSTELLAITLGVWRAPPGDEAQLGDAVEVFKTEAWGSSYRSPVGTNLGQAAFEYVALSIMAQEDGTEVEIDLGGNGSVDATVVLNEGESFLQTGVTVGTTVEASPLAGDDERKVQVDILSAQAPSGWEGRWSSLPP